MSPSRVWPAEMLCAKGAGSGAIRAGLLIALALAGCAPPRRDVGPVVVSAIGGEAAVRDPSRRAIDEPGRVLLGATAQGLVRFDANGQIEPGLAERWIVIDNGMSYIFRLRDARWPDGAAVTAAEVVASLRRGMARDTRNPLAPFLSAIDEIVEMTPEVIEVRLLRPRPDLLKLFAAPEMAILRPRTLAGSGPFRATAVDGGALRLAPAPDPARDDDRPTAAEPEHSLLFRGERAARAVARFALRGSDLVGGGTFADWPVVAAAAIAPANIRLDPAAGLFGLAVTDRSGLLADPAERAAVSGALDRAAIATAIGSTAAETILPDQLDSAATVALPAWSTTPLEERQAAARARIAAWRARTGAVPTLRIALPAGPGATTLFGVLGAQLYALGIVPRRVAIDAPADLRLIDAVAPYDSARWYLATACVACGEQAADRLAAARVAGTLAERTARIAEADTALTADAGFIPLARPVRWSLVSLRLGGWQGNSRAWHPLNHLRNDPE